MSPGRLPPPRWLVVALAVLAVVATGVISLLPFLDDIERVDDDQAAPAISAPGRGDDFDRPDGPLATTDRPWTEPAGDWVIQDAHAALTVPAGAGTGPAVLDTGMALLDDGEPWTTAAVTATALEPGWAFAFLVAGPDDYWALTPDRQNHSRWVLQRMIEGRVEFFYESVEVAPRDGARIEIALRPEGVVVTVDGVTAEPRPIDDTNATGVGLVAFDSSRAASMAWDDLTLT